MRHKKRAMKVKWTKKSEWAKSNNKKWPMRFLNFAAYLSALSLEKGQVRFIQSASSCIFRRNQSVVNVCVCFFCAVKCVYFIQIENSSTPTQTMGEYKTGTIAVKPKKKYVMQKKQRTRHVWIGSQECYYTTR